MHVCTRWHAVATRDDMRVCFKDFWSSQTLGSGSDAGAGAEGGRGGVRDPLFHPRWGGQGAGERANLRDEAGEPIFQQP